MRDEGAIRCSAARVHSLDLGAGLPREREQVGERRPVARHLEVPLAARGPHRHPLPLLYLALAQDGLAAVDVSDTGHPKLMGRFLEGRIISQVLAEGDQLVALEVREEAVRLSVANPPAPPGVRGTKGSGPAAMAPVESGAAPPVVAQSAALGVAVPAPPQAKVAEVNNGRIIVSLMEWRRGRG